MSRLYGKISSDRRKTSATAGAHEEITSRLTWGSANNPWLAVSVELRWNKDKAYPTAFITVGNDIKVNVLIPGMKPITKQAG